MIIDYSVPGTDGESYDLPKLDRLPYGSLHILPNVDGWVYGSEGIAVEQHVDAYLKEFGKVFHALCRVCGPKRAMNIILTRRNQDKSRDRLKAAKELAEMVPAMLALKKVAKSIGFYLDWDSREAGSAWVWDVTPMEGPEFTGVMVGVLLPNDDPDNGHPTLVVAGGGDGYHRASAFNCNRPWFCRTNSEHCCRLEQVNDVMKLFRDHVKLAREEQEQYQAEAGGESVPVCDERYWKDYLHIRKMLLARRKKS